MDDTAARGRGSSRSENRSSLEWRSGRRITEAYYVVGADIPTDSFPSVLKPR